MSSIRENLPDHQALLSHYPIEIGFGRKHGACSCFGGGTDCQRGTFDAVSRVQAVYTYFATCQLSLDIRDQIVRQDYSSVCVQGSHWPCKCFRLQIKWIDEQSTV